jgi:hypothetical protein
MGPLAVATRQPAEIFTDKHIENIYSFIRLLLLCFFSFFLFLSVPRLFMLVPPLSHGSKNRPRRLAEYGRVSDYCFMVVANAMLARIFLSAAA